MKYSLWVLGVCLFSWVWSGCNFVSKYPIDEQPSVKLDERYTGIWKIREDKDSNNYVVITNADDYRLKMTYMDKGGTNRSYENYAGYLSLVKGERFINVHFRADSVEGYFLMRILDFSGWKLTAAMVADSSLGDMNNAGEVRALVTRNIHNKHFYDDTFHYYKLLPLSFCKCK